MQAIFFVGEQTHQLHADIAASTAVMSSGILFQLMLGGTYLKTTQPIVYLVLASAKSSTYLLHAAVGTTLATYWNNGHTVHFFYKIGSSKNETAMEISYSCDNFLASCCCRKMRILLAHLRIFS